MLGHFPSRSRITRLVALSCLVVLLSSRNVVGVAACNLSLNGCGNTSTTQCPLQDPQIQGGIQSMQYGNPSWPQRVWATISSYNPSPVWSTSSAWTMLENLPVPTRCGYSGCYAQVGWIHWGDCADLPLNSGPGGGGSCSNSTQEHVFTEWSSDNGTDEPVFYYNVPSGNENFYITRASSGYGGYYTYYFYWNEGSANSATTLTWGPAGIENAEEVHDYALGGEGSQYGGDDYNRVQFSGMQWEGSDYIDRTPSMSIEQGGYSAISASNPITSSMSLWDNRC